MGKKKQPKKKVTTVSELDVPIEVPPVEERDDLTSPGVALSAPDEEGFQTFVSEEMEGIDPAEIPDNPEGTKVEEAPVIETVSAEPEPTVEELHEILTETATDIQLESEVEEEAEGDGPEYGELENMLIVCEQCGRATLVLVGDKLPELCRCGLLYNYANESVTTEIQIAEPMMLSVRKVPRKFTR